MDLLTLLVWNAGFVVVAMLCVWGVSVWLRDASIVEVSRPSSACRAR
jgi:hypothetical protein